MLITEYMHNNKLRRLFIHKIESRNFFNLEISDKNTLNHMDIILTDEDIKKLMEFFHKHITN